MIIPNNEIWLKTSDDSYMSIDTTDFVQNYVGTVHEDGWWKYSFDADITRIGRYACDGYTYLTDVILPETVTAIGNNAFNGDSSLASINFPDSLETIGAGAFCYCAQLTEVTLKHVRTIGQEAFMGCYNISSLDLGDSLTRIELRGFYSHSTKGKIVELTLPATLNYLGGASFNSQGITTINFLSEDVPSQVATAFYSNTVAEVNVPYGSRSYYRTALEGLTQFTGATFSYIGRFDSVYAGYDECTVRYSIGSGTTLTAVDTDLEYEYDAVQNMLVLSLPVRMGGVHDIGLSFDEDGISSEGVLRIFRNGDDAFLMSNYTGGYRYLIVCHEGGLECSIGGETVTATEYAEIEYPDGTVMHMSTIPTEGAGYGEHTAVINNAEYTFYQPKEISLPEHITSTDGLDFIDGYTLYVPVISVDGHVPYASLTLNVSDYLSGWGIREMDLYDYLSESHTEGNMNGTCSTDLYHVSGDSEGNKVVSIYTDYLTQPSYMLYHLYYNADEEMCSWMMPVVSVNRVLVDSPTVVLDSIYEDGTACLSKTVDYMGSVNIGKLDSVRFNVRFYMSNNSINYGIPLDVDSCRAYTNSSNFRNPEFLAYTVTRGEYYTCFNTIWEWSTSPSGEIWERELLMRFCISNSDGTYTNTSMPNYSGKVPYGQSNVMISLTGVRMTAQIPSEVEEDTDYDITITYPTGNELLFNTPKDVIITVDSVSITGDATVASGTLRVNEENTASTVTVTVTDGHTTIARTINILEKEPPMAAPTITINKYANLSFPQEGATRYITITYGNTTSQFINTPYSTVLGTTITAESTTEGDTDVSVYYAVSVPATTYKRDIPLIFSCSNAAGLSCTETFTGMQEGETYGTEYCNITAVPSGLSFPASGGTQRVTVTAAYPDADNPIKASVRHATMGITISWCKAVFVSRTYDDDYSSVTEEWDITMNPNEASEPSSAAVTFSYTNSSTYGGDSASVTVIATQDAADPGLPESSLSLYRTVMNFNATGGFDLGDAVCKADYRWTNEEDIEEPVIDGDWIAVTEGTHQTGAGYIIIPWQIAVSHNTTNESRTGTVTFSSIGQDDVEHTIVLTVIQTGMDSSVETPEYVDLLWKDCEVVLGDDDMTFSILDENYDEFYTGRCRKRPDGDTNWFFINKIVQDYVYMEEIPKLLDGTADYQEHENGYRHFRLDTPDTVGAMRGFYFKYDWSYTEDSPFILSESIIPYVVEGQKNLITYCNLSYNDVQTDTYSWIMKDGSMERGGITANEEEYATKVAVMPENADYYVLGGQRYEVITPCQSKYVLYYLSPKGGWCWFPITGKVNASDRLTTFTISRNYDNTKMQFGKSRYTVDISTDYELSTGFLTESQSLRMWEMLESNMCYLHDMEKDVIFPVLMKQDTVEKKRYQRGQQKMLSYTFTVETSQGRMRM